MPEPEAAIGGGASGKPPDRLGERLLWSGRLFGISVAALLVALCRKDPLEFISAYAWQWSDVLVLLGVYAAGLFLSFRFPLTGGLIALAMAVSLLDAWGYSFRTSFSLALSAPAALVVLASFRQPHWWSAPLGRLLSALLGPDVREGLRQGGRFLGTAGLAYFFLGFLPSYDRRLYVYDPAEAGVLLGAFAYVAGLLWAWAWPRAGGLLALAGFAAFLLLEGEEVPDTFRQAPLLTITFLSLYGIPPFLLFHSGARRFGTPEADSREDEGVRPGRFKNAVLVLLSLALLGVLSTKAGLRPRGYTGAVPIVRLSPVRYSGERGISVIASLKTLVTAEEQYKSTGGGNVYAALTQLSAATPPYVDSVLASGKKSGYCFVLSVGTPADSNWYATARPVTPGKTGNRFFFVDSSGVIRFTLTGPATSADTPID